MLFKITEITESKQPKSLKKFIFKSLFTSKKLLHPLLKNCCQSLQFYWYSFRVIKEARTADRRRIQFACKGKLLSCKVKQR